MDGVQFERPGPAGCITGIGPVPGRSSLTVTVIRGSVIRTVAYYRNEESAQILADGMRCLLAPGLQEESHGVESRTHNA